MTRKALEADAYKEGNEDLQKQVSQLETAGELLVQFRTYCSIGLLPNNFFLRYFFQLDLLIANSWIIAIRTTRRAAGPVVKCQTHEQ